MVCGFAVVTPASAQVLFNETFENASFAPGGFGGGDVTGRTSANVAGVGTAGSRGVQVGATFNPPGQGFAQMAIQVFKSSAGTAETDLSRFIVGLNIRVDTLVGTGTSFDLTVQSFTPNGQMIVQGNLQRNAIPFSATPNVYTRIEVPPSTFAAGTTAFDPSALNIQFNIVLNTFRKGFSQNPSTTHRVFVDNVSLTVTPAVVPEAGTLALLGLGVVPIALYLRRHK